MLPMSLLHCTAVDIGYCGWCETAVRLASSQQAQGLGGVKLKYNGMWDVVTKTVRHEGFFGLYKASDI
jgi:hypothetical protein